MLQKTNKENRSIFIGFTKSVEGYGKGTEFHDILWFVKGKISDSYITEFVV